MSLTYEAPLAHMRFVVERVLGAPALWRECERFEGLDAETAGAVIEEAARFVTEVLLPLRASADAEGCTRDAEGNVRTPRGFADAHRAFVEGGWPALAADPEWGGQGLPLLLDAALREMIDACNHAWNMGPALLHGAYEAIRSHGSDELRSRYLPKLASGQWLAAMALTEPQAGSDLGALATRALPQPDGTLRVSGHKIFISGGEHDLTDNIVHLVLCRLPDAPPGSKGITLALVPKVLPDGARNAVHCDAIEHKMGIHGSATCAMRYEGATGWIVGAPNQGLAAMFVMMNSARLHVGLQGLGHQEFAVQNARRWAQVRTQFGRPIARHAAMRHILLRNQTLVEAQRVIAYRAALAIDLAHHHCDAARREREGRYAALLTPVVKAYCSERGFEGASEALQVFGGYGYVRETGIEQTLRDARIAMIYEGTNEIQAIDLVQRKVLGDGGATLRELLAELQADAAPGEFCFDALRAQCDAAREGAAALAAFDSPEALLAAADDFLHGLAHTLLAWAFAAQARAAAALDDAAQARALTEHARYGVQWLLPQAAVHWQRVRAANAAALPQLVD
jgi:alkylation response protein AidB-like acyl-CoA dehydrogenase